MLFQCFYLINSVVTAWVSVRRLDKFLHEVNNYIVSIRPFSLTKFVE